MAKIVISSEDVARVSPTRSTPTIPPSDSLSNSLPPSRPPQNASKSAFLIGLGVVLVFLIIAIVCWLATPQRPDPSSPHPPAQIQPVARPQQPAVSPTASNKLLFDDKAKRWPWNRYISTKGLIVSAGAVFLLAVVGTLWIGSGQQEKQSGQGQGGRVTNEQIGTSAATSVYKTGQSCFDRGDYDAAIVAFAEAIRLNPQYAEAYFSRGVAYAAKSKSETIENALDQPTQIEFVETPLKDVVDYLKDLHKITIQLDVAALKEAGVDESTPVTKNLKGISLRSALKVLLDELQLKFVVHNDVLLITTQVKAEEADRDIDDFTEAIRLNPQYTEAYFNRGLAYWNRGDWDAAIADYTAVIRLNPKYTETYRRRAMIYDIKGDLDKEIADYTEAIRLDHKNAVTYFNRGFVYQQKGEYDKAIADFTQTIRLDPQAAVPYFYRGLAFGNKSDWDKEIADSDEAIRLNPKYAMAYNNRGFAIALDNEGTIDHVLVSTAGPGPAGRSLYKCQDRRAGTEGHEAVRSGAGDRHV